MRVIYIILHKKWKFIHKGLTNHSTIHQTINQHNINPIPFLTNQSMIRLTVPKFVHHSFICTSNQLSIVHIFRFISSVELAKVMSDLGERLSEEEVKVVVVVVDVGGGGAWKLGWIWICLISTRKFNFQTQLLFLWCCTQTKSAGE